MGCNCGGNLVKINKDNKDKKNINKDKKDNNKDKKEKKDNNKDKKDDLPNINLFKKLFGN